MNELQVKTIKLEPAKVEFNYTEIEKELEKNLQRYNGLTFTEDTATELRSTIAELRKGKKAVDEYRKKIKKELTTPVTEFENKCKGLNKKFDEVINPLVEQQTEFEEKRKREKTEKINEIIKEVIEEKGLNDKYASKLNIDDSMLAKSMSMKQVKETLEFVANNLFMQQQKEEMDKQLIKSHVELTNAKLGLNLIDSSYTSLLEFQDVEMIKAQIDSHAKKELSKQEEKKQDPVKEAPPVNEAELPFEDITPHYTTIVYRVVVTFDQKKELEKQLSVHTNDWEVVDVE